MASRRGPMAEPIGLTRDAGGTDVRVEWTAHERDYLFDLIFVVFADGRRSNVSRQDTRRPPGIRPAGETLGGTNPALMCSDAGRSASRGGPQARHLSAPVRKAQGLRADRPF